MIKLHCPYWVIWQFNYLSHMSFNIDISDIYKYVSCDYKGGINGLVYGCNHYKKIEKQRIILLVFREKKSFVFYLNQLEIFLFHFVFISC